LTRKRNEAGTFAKILIFIRFLKHCSFTR